MKLVSVSEMKAIEAEANASGWTYDQMMEQAGSGLADVVQSFYGYKESQMVTGLVGSGNNGGDTLVALVSMAEMGWQANAYLVRARPQEDELVQRFTGAGGRLAEAAQDGDFAKLDEWLRESTVLLDGVLGTGIALPLKAEVGQVLRHVKDFPFCPPVVAVDCPSGVDCDSGQAADETLQAEVTICMAAIKTGLLRFPAHSLVGDIQVVEIGLPEGLKAWDEVRRSVMSEEDVRSVLPQRTPDSHKGTFGTATLCAGSLNYSGAALLAGKAAGRIGAGLVSLAIPAALHTALAGWFPEAVWVLLPHQMGAISGDAADVLLKSLEKTTALLVGPGLGQEDCTADFIRRLLEGRRKAAAHKTMGFFTAVEANEAVPSADDFNLPPLVFDADGLRLLARLENWFARLPAVSVLTPHPGEMAALTGLDSQTLQADRVGTAEKFARQWGHVVVLKGAFTVIAGPDGRTAVISVATSALAHAGTGDVLAGIITGLRAQGVPAFEAAAAGAWIHAQAGLAAVEKVGHEASVLAGDVLESIPEVLSWVW